jgi:hypothetical protein
MLRERVSIADFESDHFAAQLVERLGWAVSDAHDVEHTPEPEHAPEPEHMPESDRAPEPARTLEPSRH